jgi:hypothetical protein
MRYGLKPRYDRLRDLGMLTLDEIAKALTVHPTTVKTWAVHGLVRRHAYSDKPECLYESPGQDAPRWTQHNAASMAELITWLVETTGLEPGALAIAIEVPAWGRC